MPVRVNPTLRMATECGKPLRSQVANTARPPPPAAAQLVMNVQYHGWRFRNRARPSGFTDGKKRTTNQLADSVELSDEMQRHDQCDRQATQAVQSYRRVDVAISVPGTRRLS